MANGCVEVVEDAILTQNPVGNVASENSRDALNLTIIFEALETCKKKSKAQSVEKVVELCMKDLGWSQAYAGSMIEKAKDQGVIKEIIFGGKPALRKNNQSVIFRDRLGFTSTQTTGTNIYSEFMQFKKATSSEIANLHASTESKKIGMDTNDSKALLIRCLQDHIASLEKCLDEKQIIIEENTKIIANLISIHIEGNGKHKGLHDNQLLQSQGLKQVHDMEATPKTIDITAEQRSQQSAMNKKGKKKPNQQKGYDAPQKNQAPDGTQYVGKERNATAEYVDHSWLRLGSSADCLKNFLLVVKSIVNIGNIVDTCKFMYL